VKDSLIDDLGRALAQPISRRHTMRLFLAGGAALALPALRPRLTYAGLTNTKLCYPADQFCSELRCRPNDTCCQWEACPTCNCRFARTCCDPCGFNNTCSATTGCVPGGDTCAACCRQRGQGGPRNHAYPCECFPPGEIGNPTLGRRVNVAVVRGTVLVKVPGDGGFVPLDEARQIPVGSLLDTRNGTVRLTSARDRQGNTQTGQFEGGIFKVLQGRNSGGLTELRLTGGDFGACATSRKDSRRGGLNKKVVRRLEARARGKFRTRGRFSASTVRGTVWTTADRCDGTLTKVTNGSVVVLDIPRRRTVTVGAGRSYLASPPA
jgi:hypothetical protein